MKKVVIVNGSPRKNGNTAEMLRHAANGARDAGAEVVEVNLYGLNYKGCISCFSCKTKDTSKHGKCALKDDLSPVLETIQNSDVLIVGTPMYIHNITGATQSFLERLVFMHLSYDSIEETYYDGKLNIGFVYTMGMPKENLESVGYNQMFENQKQWKRIFGGEVEYITTCDAYQFSDYSKYAAGMFNVEKKAKLRETQFPIDCQNAYDMGKRLVEQA